MAQFRFIPIPAEDYEALGVSADRILQTYFTEDGALMIRAVDEDELADYVCGGDCEKCPLSDDVCDGDCESCPCYINGEDDEHGCRREMF